MDIRQHLQWMMAQQQKPEYAALVNHQNRNQKATTAESADIKDFLLLLEQDRDAKPPIGTGAANTPVVAPIVKPVAPTSEDKSEAIDAAALQAWYNQLLKDLQALCPSGDCPWYKDWVNAIRQMIEDLEDFDARIFAQLLETLGRRPGESDEEWFIRVFGEYPIGEGFPWIQNGMSFEIWMQILILSVFSRGISARGDLYRYYRDLLDRWRNPDAPRPFNDYGGYAWGFWRDAQGNIIYITYPPGGPWAPVTPTPPGSWFIGPNVVPAVHTFDARERERR